ncbi:GntR family transcriptional regulator [Herbiconiux sp. KACC 21604]|uniref:GntR family transcriptional regulator n=1 Tax=unclassified Herbiconiux TaxID=2618217 RepID=UPI0014929C7E|nr:GntR family transcriptional regulator [Herbiconiux sp. SALV-R1]QJU53129.1 GntR family transcriptional regulator [Herbiconiux sp. SALV-R1]WPO88070.1 GntR family transcriptional regulator [Herbiconiux sp. KACC 21604]
MTTTTSTPSLVRALRTVSAVDAVGDDLRRRMFAGELVGGELLKEAVVAGEYAVSRSTAKAAIEKLTAEGLLERSANRSARVPQLTAADVHDIYRTRLRLESSALRELAAARHAPREAAAANARVRAAGVGAAAPRDLTVAHDGERGSAIASVEPDMRFHAALVEAIGSERLERMYGSLVDEARLCMVQVQGRSLLAVDRIADEHDEILRRLAAGDADGAVEVLTAHLTRASDRLQAALDA